MHSIEQTMILIAISSESFKLKLVVLFTIMKCIIGFSEALKRWTLSNIDISFHA